MSDRPTYVSRSFLIQVTAGMLAAVAIFCLGRYTAPSASLHSAAAGVSRNESTAVPSLATASAAAGESPQRFSPDQVAAWRRQLDTAAPNAARGKERLRMLAAWARTAPQAALEYVRKNMPKDRQSEALTTIFEAWAGQDPSAAWDWVLTKENGDAGHLRTVLTEVAKTSPVMAQSFADAYAVAHPDLASNAYLSALDGIMYTGDYAGAQQMIAQAKVPNDEQRNILLNFLAGEWARYQPESAAQWALGLPAGPVRSQALDAVGQAWSDADPARAADFAVNLPAGPERQTALTQAVSKWSAADPVRAEEWVLQYNAHGDFDQAVAAIATSADLMNHNVALALGWAATIQQETLRRQSTITVLSTWYSSDPAPALNYIKNSTEVAADVRQELLKILPVQN